MVDNMTNKDTKMTLGEVCTHGSLKRSCMVCELWLERDRLQSRVTELEKLANRMAEALGRISRVSQFGRDGGPIVSSEHYEEAWLDCAETAKEALAAFREGKVDK